MGISISHFDLILNEGDLRLNFFALEIKAIDGRLEGLPIRADLLKFCLVRRDLLVKARHLLVVCIELCL